MRWVVVMFAVAGCSQSSTDAALTTRAESLSQRVHEEEERLRGLNERNAALSRQIADQEQRLADAQCRATRAEIRAQVARREAICMGARVTFARCAAQEARDTTDRTLLGGLLGLAAAAVTGGAAAPFVLGGVAAGSATENVQARCGTSPTCEMDVASLEREVLARRGLDQPPTCGDGERNSSERCAVVVQWSVHLRPRMVAESIGDEYPEGTPFDVLAPGDLWRGDQRIFRVQPEDGAPGWIFLDTATLQAGGCRWTAAR